jgi:hypothetical protein
VSLIVVGLLGFVFHDFYRLEIEYHHAVTQTGPTVQQIEKLKDLKCTRDTQTAELHRMATVSGQFSASRHKKSEKISPQDTTKDQSTQHFGDANDPLFQSVRNDTEVEVTEYETFEKREKRINLADKVRLIQRNFRRVRLNQCVRECAAEYRRLMAIKKKQEDRQKQDYITSNRKSENFPITKKDFDILFAQIAAWKEAEVSVKVVAINFYSKIEIINRQGRFRRILQDRQRLLSSEPCWRRKFSC